MIIAFRNGEVEDMASLVRRAVEHGTPVVTIDLANVTYLDPAALRTVGDALEAAHGAGGTLRFAHASSVVYKALHVAHLA